MRDNPGLSISIHVLREEDDQGKKGDTGPQGPFLSTSSARRTTTLLSGGELTLGISIHVLREEDDETEELRKAFEESISIHDLREEDDR